MPPAGYYGNVNPDLLRFIPPDCRTVLEIGCGKGALCEAYRRVNPGVEWFGVEAGSCGYEARRTPLDFIEVDDVEDSPGHVYACNNEADWRHCPEVDCLIFGDVLEHLLDPWETLKELVRLRVKPGAQVLACIPNVQHWTVIRDLLEGKWDYADSGLLDRTHLRFFTLKSIRQMFDAAGLQVFEIVGRDICNGGAMEWAYDHLVAAPQTTMPKECLAYQYVVRAAKPATYKGKDYTLVDVVASPKLHIHAVTAEACCARPRILEPFAMLGTIPGVKCTTSSTSAIPDASPDILVMQRARAYSIHFYQHMIEKGRIVIAEIDDLPEAIGMDPMVLRAVHAVQCSTEALAEVCRQYNPNVMVFPNQIAELPPFDRVKKLPHDDTVRIFFGAQNRQTDWDPIMPAFLRVLADHRNSFVTVIHDREFYDAIPNYIVNKEFHPFCEYAEYRRLLGRCDIALLPLEDTPFNRCKSDIKFLECAAEGVAVLASETVYAQSLHCGKYGLCYSGPEMFEHWLREMIVNYKHSVVDAKNAYAYVRDNRLLSQHYRARYKWYQSLLNSKQALTDSLLERVPELSERLATA